MKVSVPVSTPARDSAAQASGPWMARNTRSSGSTLQSKPAASSRRCASSTAALPALATTMKRSAPSRVTIRSSMMPACSLRKNVYFDCDDRQRRRRRAGRPSADQLGGARSRHLEQPHVRNVEQAGMLARVQVLLHDAGRIGDRHRPAGKRPEARAGRDMQVFEGEVFQVRGRSLLLQSARIRPLSRPVRAPLSEA